MICISFYGLVLWWPYHYEIVSNELRVFCLCLLVYYFGTY